MKILASRTIQIVIRYTESSESEMEKKNITSERGITYYWVERNTDPSANCIVFTHGLTANHTMFEKQVEYFKHDYTVITWDVPLHGESRPYKEFTYDNTAKELYTILESENISKVFLVGMSMGGYPCQMFAAKHPDKVLAFVALDTTPLGLCYYSKSDKWWLKRAGPIAKWYPDKLLRSGMAKSVSKTRYARVLMEKMLAPLTKNEICEQMGIAYGQFLEENMDVYFNFPVLILLGEHDKTGKVKQYCKAWAEKEGYPLYIIKDAAHFANADNSSDVNSAIQRFLCAL